MQLYIEFLYLYQCEVIISVKLLSSFSICCFNLIVSAFVLSFVMNKVV